MAVEIGILMIAALFFIIGMLLFNGKGKWLIAGYNTASEEEKKRYDEKKLCKAVGSLCMVCFIMLCSMAYMGYKIRSGAMGEAYMRPLVMVFIAVILIAIIIVIRYINTKAKK